MSYYLTLCILIFGIYYIKMSGWLPVLDMLWGGGLQNMWLIVPVPHTDS